jgi:hypothetical protein
MREAALPVFGVCEGCRKRNGRQADTLVGAARALAELDLDGLPTAAFLVPTWFERRFGLTRTDLTRLVEAARPLVQAMIQRRPRRTVPARHRRPARVWTVRKES